MREMYPAFLASKLWLKMNTPIGRFANLSVLELVDDPAPVAAPLHTSEPS
jgi:hypothetical protein